MSWRSSLRWFRGIRHIKPTLQDDQHMARKDQQKNVRIFTSAYDDRYRLHSLNPSSRAFGLILDLTGEFGSRLRFMELFRCGRSTKFSSRAIGLESRGWTAGLMAWRGIVVDCILPGLWDVSGCEKTCLGVGVLLLLPVLLLLLLLAFDLKRKPRKLRRESRLLEDSVRVIVALLTSLSCGNRCGMGDAR